MAYQQGLSASRTVFLTLVDVPAVGVPFSDVTLRYKKQGQTALTIKVLQTQDWVELGDGIYSINFSANDMDTVGDFTFTLESGSGLFDNFVYDEFTVEPAVASNTAQVPQQCVVYGNVANQSALAPQHLKVTARPVQFPAKFNNTVLASDIVWTYADAYGNFSLALVRKSVCIIEIERTGIRAQITVPDSPTAQLIDLLPPINVDYGI